MVHNSTVVLAVDVGSRRVGVARGMSDLRLAYPLTVIEQSAAIYRQLSDLVTTNGATAVVVGLPRNLQGEETAQTAACRHFAEQLEAVLTVPVYLQDEALTSRQAEAALAGRPHLKGDIDALAAVYILEDYFSQHQDLSHA